MKVFEVRLFCLQLTFSSIGSGIVAGANLVDWWKDNGHSFLETHFNVTSDVDSWYNTVLKSYYTVAGMCRY